jgi:regulator of sigma E protease
MAGIIQKSIGDPLSITLMRGDSAIQKQITPRKEILTVQGEEMERWIIGIQSKYAWIGSVIEGGPADSAGIRSGDLITEVSGKEIRTWQDMTDIFHASPGDTVPVTWLRGDSVMHASVVPKLQKIPVQGSIEEVGLIGVDPKYRMRPVGFFRAFAMGGQSIYYNVKLIANSINMLITGKESPKSLGGPVFIAQIAGESAKLGWEALIGFMAFLSVNLAILNILPIPVLDGGHILYLIIEGIIRRPIPLKVKLFIQQIGILLILGLMIFVLYNDIMRIFGR